MKNQKAISNILAEIKNQIDEFLPDYDVKFESPMNIHQDKQVSLFIYDVEENMSYKLSSKEDVNVDIPKNIALNMKFLVTIFDADNYESTISFTRLYLGLNKTDFIKNVDNQTLQRESTKLVIDSTGYDVWTKLFPQSDYRQSISFIAQHVTISVDDS
ncbi:MAG: DUF4255 domain-containing protein [Nitrosopumilus sp.]|nr:DUF4255 domain-containing protein [Nitrosopumilus sp.]MDH5659163.1 DUF4255 domain-containing protein [Nitrosopumilus sp.]